MNRASRCLILLTLLGAGQQVLAQNVYIYPSKGQSQAQQDKDKYECYDWARSNTGYDPANPASSSSASTSSPRQQSGGVVRGALAGAAIGAIAGDTSKAAGRGALAGGLFGGIRQSSTNQQAQQQHSQKQASQSRARLNEYNRANAACLEGRGYTVK